MAQARYAHPQEYTHQVRNFIAFGLDSVFFATNLSFLDIYTILPSFVAQLTTSSIWIGSIATFFGLYWSIPQIFAGNFVAKFEKKKPVLLVAACTGRLAIPLMAGIIYFTGAQPAWLSIVLIYVALGCLMLTDAFSTVAWLDILGRSFPPNRRGGYMSIWQGITGVFRFGVAVLVGLLLGPEGPSFPNNYVLIFLGSACCLFISVLAIIYIHEPEVGQHETATARIPWRDFARHVVRIMREDLRLRRITITRTLFLFATMASPLYVVYAANVLRLPPETIGLFIVAQTIGTLLASLALGRIGDRYGSRWMIRIGTAVVVSAPLLALAFALGLIPAQGPLVYLYMWIYVGVGLSQNLIFLGFMNYSLDITAPGQRPIYMGATNTISSIGVLGPSLGGAILQATGSYVLLFVVSLLFGLVSLVLSLTLPPSEEPHPISGNQEAPA